MPMKPTEAIHDRVVLDRLHCTDSAAMMNEMSPTSMASSAQPTPEPATSRPCSGLKGSRSRRSERVSTATAGEQRDSCGPVYPVGGRRPQADAYAGRAAEGMSG